MTFNQDVSRIRSHIKSQIESLDRLESQATDPSVRKALRLPRSRYEEVDRTILSRIETEPMQERWRLLWLVAAELQLRMADEQSRGLESALRAYGPNAKFIGG